MPDRADLVEVVVDEAVLAPAYHVTSLRVVHLIIRKDLNQGGEEDLISFIHLELVAVHPPLTTTRCSIIYAFFLINRNPSLALYPCKISRKMSIINHIAWSPSDNLWKDSKILSSGFLSGDIKP